MQVSVEREEGVERRLRMDIPAERLQSAVDERIKELARTVRLDGFRPGKVPLRVVRNRFGREARREVVANMLESLLAEAIKQTQIFPAGKPEIEVDDAADGGVTLWAAFEVIPEIEVTGLAGATIEKPVAEVTESDVDSMVENLRKQRQAFEDVERPAASGDQVVIDFVGRLDGEAFEGGSGENVPIELGAERMVDGFEEGIEGMQPGETRTIDVTFPEHYQAAKLAGRTTQFEVTVRTVQEARLPAVDAEFAQGFGVESGSIDELRANLRRNMERELAQRLRSELKERVLNALLERNEFDVPSPLVREEIDRMRKDMAERLGEQAPKGRLGDELFRDEATRRVRLGLLLSEVIRTNEIRADAEAVQARIEEIASSYEDPAQVVRYYAENEEVRSNIEGMVVEDRAVEALLAEATVSEQVSDFDSIMNRGG